MITALGFGVWCLVFGALRLWQWYAFWPKYSHLPKAKRPKHQTPNTKHSFALCFLVLLCVQASAQSPWTRGKAGFYAQAAWQTIPRYPSIYDKNAMDGKRVLEREITENAFQMYGEYGITPKTTVWMAIPYRFVRSGGVVGNSPTQLQAGALRGFGNISVAVRQNFIDGNLAFSGQIRIDLPRNKESQLTGLSTGYDALTLYSTLSVGQGYGKMYWYAYAGWGVRGIIGNHFIHAGSEAGVKFRKHWFILFSDYLQNIGSETYFVSPANIKTGLFLPDQSYWAFGGKGILAFSRFFGGILTVAGAFDGDLVPIQPAYSAGLYFKWD